MNVEIEMEKETKKGLLNTGFLMVTRRQRERINKTTILKQERVIMNRVLYT